MQGSDLHSLIKLLSALPSLQRVIALDRTNRYKEAWNTVSSVWRNDELRYSDSEGKEEESQRFIQAVLYLYGLKMVRKGQR